MDLPKNINPEDLTFEKVWLLFKETDKKLEKMAAKVDRLAEIYGGFMNNVARTAESFYFETLKNILEKQGVLTIDGFNFYRVIRNFIVGSKKHQKEFDLALFNTREKVLALFEIKMNFRLQDLNKFVEKALDYVREDPELYDYKVILGIGAFDYEPDVLEQARDNGLIILKPNFNDNTVIFENAEPENIKVFEP